MTHPIVSLQVSLLAALLADAELVAALGGDFIFDAPPKGQNPPYIAISRHDALSHDGDETPGYDHRLLVQCWHPTPRRKAALDIAERVIAVALGADLTGPELLVTLVGHERTDTSIDMKTGYARAAVLLRVCTEPNG